MAGRISYVMDDNPKEYPSTSFKDEAIKGIDFLRFVRTKPIKHQLDCLKHWNQRHSSNDEKGTTLIKDIALPATNGFPHGVVFSRNIPDLASLPKETSAIRVSEGRFTSQIFELKNLVNYSSKYAKLVKLCIEMKGKEFGKMFIYHPFVQGSGVDMLVSILCPNGFLLDGDHPMDNSLCMHCEETFDSHKGSHSFTPVVLTFITGSLSKVTMVARMNTFNTDDNVLGERVKIIIGSRAMRESHTLKACKHVIIAHDPSSVSEMIQIIGRAVRKRVHSMLPPEMRKVAIHILTTNVEGIGQAEEDTSSNEELAYLQKVLHYKQIDIIERIMYDVSIDYLINFRLKLRKYTTLVDREDSILLRLLSKTKNASLLWEIPKGRPNKKETPLISTTREFEEETGLVKESYRILFDQGTIEYSFIDCGVKYKYIYYLAVLSGSITPRYDYGNEHMLRELSELQFMTSNGIQELNNQRLAKLARIIIKKTKRYLG